MTEYTPFGRKLFSQKSFPLDTTMYSSENSFALCVGVTDIESAAPLPHDRRRPCGGVLQCTFRFRVTRVNELLATCTETVPSVSESPDRAKKDEVSVSSAQQSVSAEERTKTETSSAFIICLRQHETQAKILRDPQNGAIVTAHAQSSE